MISAIFCNCAFVIFATLVLFGTPEPDSILHSFLMSTEAGGVLVTKVKETVGVNGDDNRDDHADVVFGSLVEFLGECHDV